MHKQMFFLAILVLMLTATTSTGQARHRFEIKGGNFLYDGKPIQIHSGELHYARVPEPYWRQRLQMMKAMGFNAVCSYVFWNYHETSPGDWDFQTGNRNIREFIRLAGEEGLLVILRPGPYACAEWEFGGYPWWLQKNKALTIRSYNAGFLDSCNVYLKKLGEQVRDLQVTHGGPLVMIQAENEFGSYVAQQKDISLEAHKKYSAAIRQQLVDAGFDIPFFTSDGTSLFAGGTIEGALPTANGESDIESLKEAVDKFHNGEGPYMIGEYYPGWLDHWAEPFQQVSTKEVTDQVEKYLKAGVSFNFYMVHGGTNFGFTSGANYSGEHDLQPDITSYDYDAPISEAGWATPKYNAVRELFIKYGDKAPLPPARIPVIDIAAIRLSKAVDLFVLKEKIKPVVNDKPETFEDLNQGYGYVLYSKSFISPTKGKLEINGLRDYAIIYVNQVKVAELNRNMNKYSCVVDIPAGGTLDILVENMGRINYGKQITDNLKGIISPITIDGNEVVTGWKMYGFPMDKEPALDVYPDQYVRGHPVIYQGKFKLLKKGDTFLDMSHLGKGIVFVNGHHLGRYWQVGPQQTLYLPGCWLNKGLNSITVFEQLNDEQIHEIRSIKEPILNDLRK